MSTGKQGLFVVVWEWENKQRRWRPYPPEVTQHLERAKEKTLSVVFLGDADPNLKNYCINLSGMQQECQISGERVSVRRSFFPQSSPAGQGAVWQWQGDNTGDWHVYDMCVQCIIESAWTTGAQTVDLSQTFPLCPYTINFCNLTQINSRTTFSRSIRRIQQAAYPVGKPPRVPQPMPPDQGPNIYNDRNRKHGNRDNTDPGTDPKRRGFMDKVFGRSHGNCTGSSSNSKSSPTHMDNSEYRPSGNSKTGRSNSPVRPNPSPRRAPIPAPRTILPNHQNPPQQHQYPSQTHHHQHQKYESDSQRLISGRSLRSEAGASRFGSDRTLDSDCSSLGGRRPSADTISTYLSDDHNHNSKYQNHDDRT